MSQIKLLRVIDISEDSKDIPYFKNNDFRGYYIIRLQDKKVDGEFLTQELMSLDIDEDIKNTSLPYLKPSIDDCIKDLQKTIDNHSSSDRLNRIRQRIIDWLLSKEESD